MCQTIGSVLICVFLACCVFLVGATASAQCQPQWLPGDGLPGADGPVSSTTMWDPDGLGPLPPRLVVAGSFNVMGGVAANRIAAFDPATSTWSALGSGMNGMVRALAVLPNGDLVAGGDFTTAGGVAANYIARWNGNAWSELDGGMNNLVYALAVLPNGDLVAGGFFTNAGGVAGNHIARWNGSAWSVLGSGMNNLVFAVAVLPNGDLVAGGFFATAGGVTANRIARWSGSAWSALGSGMAGGSGYPHVQSLCVCLTVTSSRVATSRLPAA